MVLLTISIAVPLIGLLGTVLGVMITFASIAAAGEVNVNAIAPGIAAALLATVAACRRHSGPLRLQLHFSKTPPSATRLRYSVIAS